MLPICKCDVICYCRPSNEVSETRLDLMGMTTTLPEEQETHSDTDTFLNEKYVHQSPVGGSETTSMVDKGEINRLSSKRKGRKARFEGDGNDST